MFEIYPVNGGLTYSSPNLYTAVTSDTFDLVISKDYGQDLYEKGLIGEQSNVFIKTSDGVFLMSFTLDPTSKKIVGSKLLDLKKEEKL
ncbi:MAG: hypothetical protein RJA83_659 [Pseudomonadota bacterium]|jgi:hypothetical protein